ncbi:hypothetical protein ABES23_14470 [Peribacillus frigoritolerans]|uniref:hypothetical protein n=1 Tax=Peribacillus frigoritolerans TaxID=450367 RepID=UPI003D2C4C3E
MKTRDKKKAIPLIATTLLVTTAFTTQPFIKDGIDQKTQAKEFSKEEKKQNRTTWLTGDHHIHSEWSVDWDKTKNPPGPIKGGDVIYPNVKNA